MKKRNKKLLIIGLDGVPFEMIKKLIEEGTMQNLKEIFKTGKCVRMSATIPEISSVSWSSFMTGTDSGNHGIFGFVDLYKGTYDIKFPNFKDLKCPTFFDYIGKKKKNSVVINLPSTYPARKIQGVLISGFISVDLKNAVYPEKYLKFLEDQGYKVDINAAKGKDKKKEFISDLQYTLKVRKNVSDFLWKNENWDLFMFTITGTDRLHHFLYDAYEDQNHKFHNDFKNYYEEIDSIIGDFYNKIKVKEEFEIIMLSDHGFGLIKKEIYINQILRKYGFFNTETYEPESLAEITEDSSAFALDPSRIYIHLKNKYPKAKFDKKDYKKVREDIRKLFEEYEIEGKKIIKKVYFKEEIYSNRFLDSAPDILLLSNHGFDLKGGLKKKEEWGKSHFTGMHIYDNAFFFTTKPEYLPEKMTIFDVKNIILKSINL